VSALEQAKAVIRSYAEAWKDEEGKALRLFLDDHDRLTRAVDDANERLRLCEVPDGWEAWRINAEAEVERLKEIDRASFRAWEKSEVEVARLTRERQALLVLWQDGPSLPDCHACAVVGAALCGEGEK
jgi:hypothetical protein